MEDNINCRYYQAEEIKDKSERPKSILLKRPQRLREEEIN